MFSESLAKSAREKGEGGGAAYGWLHKNQFHCRSTALSTDLSVKIGLLALYESKHPRL